MAATDNNRVALGCWGQGAFHAIPKSVFAAVAWHLANVASDACDEPGMAELRFLQEWNALLPLGLSPPTKAARVALAAGNIQESGDEEG